MYISYFAEAYGTGNYGSGSYSCTTAQQQAGTCATTTTGLSNTGIAVAAIVTLACLIIFIGLVVRIWRRKPAVVAQEIDDEDVARISRGSSNE
ncbi:MAG TPA: hypothetical protein VIR03_04175 [Candidatus Saccharimonadales bacterium]